MVLSRGGTPTEYTSRAKHDLGPRSKIERMSSRVPESLWNDKEPKILMWHGGFFESRKGLFHIHHVTSDGNRQEGTQKHERLRGQSMG